MDLQQYIRRPTIEISNVPETIEQRDLESYIIHQVLKRTIGYTIDPWDIEACHRLAKKNPRKPAPVVVRFVNRKHAVAAIQGRYQLKSFPHLRRIFIHDNLCPRYREIFNDLSDLKREGHVQQVWSYNGKVHYKQYDTRYGRGKRVYHLNDLEPLKEHIRLETLERFAEAEMRDQNEPSDHIDVNHVASKVLHSNVSVDISTKIGVPNPHPNSVVPVVVAPDATVSSELRNNNNSEPNIPPEITETDNVTQFANNISTPYVTTGTIELLSDVNIVTESGSPASVPAEPVIAIALSSLSEEPFVEDSTESGTNVLNVLLVSNAQSADIDGASTDCTIATSELSSVVNSSEDEFFGPFSEPVVPVTTNSSDLDKSNGSLANTETESESASCITANDPMAIISAFVANLLPVDTNEISEVRTTVNDHGAIVSLPSEPPVILKITDEFIPEPDPSTPLIVVDAIIPASDKLSNVDGVGNG